MAPDSPDNTEPVPVQPDPDRYKPTDVTAAPASSYEFALTDPDFKFPQLWRSNIAVDRNCRGLDGHSRVPLQRDVNGIYYINANLPAAQSAFVGVTRDPAGAPAPARTRMRTRINSVQNVMASYVLQNGAEGIRGTSRASAERLLTDGLG